VSMRSAKDRPTSSRAHGNLIRRIVERPKEPRTN
jgi:hypothetical protein